MPGFLKNGLCFEKPEMLSDITPWHEHVPFAFTLVDLLRPSVLVELGVLKGDSYCAFCQAVDRLGLDAKCYAVDTWEGDKQTGKYPQQVYEELEAYNNSKYGRFSTLIRSTFDEARSEFKDGSIDLLHIDGYHAYGAVKHDFESWLPKMSKRGVVLFHDTNCRLRGFGVRRLWGEIKRKYPSFEFRHGYGLGVLLVGEKIPRSMGEFLALFKEEPQAIERLFSHLGKSLEKDLLAESALGYHERAEKARRLEEELEEAGVRDRARIKRLELELSDANAKLDDVHRSTAWKAVKHFRGVMSAAIPPASRRKRVFDLGKRSAAAILRRAPVPRLESHAGKEAVASAKARTFAKSRRG